MIIIHGDLTIDPQDITDCNPRIGYQTLVTPTTVTSDQGATSRINLGNPATYLKWVADDTSEQHIGCALLAAQTVNYYGIAGHNLGDAGATVTFQSSADNVVWDDVTDGVQLQDNFALIEEFADEFRRFYRLKITGAAVIPQVAVFYVGAILRVARRIYVGHSPFTLQRKTVVSSGKSENGQFLGRVVRSTTFESEVSVQNLSPSWVRLSLDPFLAVAANTPFFWSWRPCSYPTEVGYAWTTNDPKVSNQRPNGMMDFNMSLQGIR